MRTTTAISAAAVLALWLGAASKPYAGERSDGGTTETAAAFVDPAPPEPRPELKSQTKGTWPFHSWSYAKAYTYNFFDDSPVQSMVLTDDGTWSSHIRSAQLIEETDAATAAKLVTAMHGTFETSKCTFPRHAIVYFDKADKPVAALNVCFECEGLLVWPGYEQPETYEDGDYERLEKQFMTSLTDWKDLFGRKLGLPVGYKSAR